MSVISTHNAGFFSCCSLKLKNIVASVIDNGVVGDIKSTVYFAKPPCLLLIITVYQLMIIQTVPATEYHSLAERIISLIF